MVIKTIVGIAALILLLLPLTVAVSNDSDGDGFLNFMDNCPGIAGKVQGCPVESAPWIEPIADQEIIVGETIALTIYAHDEDSDRLQLSMKSYLERALFENHGDTTGSFSWTPAAEQEGAHTIVFIADDGRAEYHEEVVIMVLPREEEALLEDDAPAKEKEDEEERQEEPEKPEVTEEVIDEEEEVEEEVEEDFEEEEDLEGLDEDFDESTEESAQNQIGVQLSAEEQRFRELQDEFDALEDDYFRARRNLREALEENDINSERRARENLEDILDDLDDVQEDVEELEENVEDQDTLANQEGLLDEADELKDNVERLRNRINILLGRNVGGSTEQVPFTFPPAPTATPASPQEEASTAVELQPFEFPFPALQQEEQVGWGNYYRPLAWGIAGIVLLLAVVVFLVMVLVVKERVIPKTKRTVV